MRTESKHFKPSGFDGLIILVCFVASAVNACVAVSNYVQGGSWWPVNVILSAWSLYFAITSIMTGRVEIVINRKDQPNGL